MSDDLAAFVAARLDEWEARAKAAKGRFSGRWYIDSDGNVQDEDTGGGGSNYVACGPWDGPVDGDHAGHIIAHDPATTLLLVASLRAILDEHAPSYPVTYPEPSGQPTCSICHAGGFDWDPDPGCSIWRQPSGQAMAAVDAAQARSREFTTELNRRLRQALGQ